MRQCFLLWVLWSVALPAAGGVEVVGELKKWHKITLEVTGPESSEGHADNPFLNYQLTGVFTRGDQTYVVPGYFAADGDAANTSATDGRVWRVHFSPDAVGAWDYRIHFRRGPGVSVADGVTAGQPVEGLDGVSGRFDVGPSDKQAPDLRARGRLEYVGGHYLRFAEDGGYFLKAGADSPENFLAYDDFDNTPNHFVEGRKRSGAYRHTWAPHRGDWRPGDPTWGEGRGTEIIGAINYLASKGMNVFSFLTWNQFGDDRNVFPYVTDENTDYNRFDCSKLDQWGIVFDHAQTQGMFLHFKLGEAENELRMNDGDVGPERKLYYRELIARYGYHLALNWNVGEEMNKSTPQQRIAVLDYFKAHDPYNHPRVVHTTGRLVRPKDLPGQLAIYRGLIGDRSAMTGTSIQHVWSEVNAITRRWVSESAQAGKPWIVCSDEQGRANLGVPLDTHEGEVTKHAIRHKVLWGNLLGGGAGVEYYFGYDHPHSDLTCDDYRSRDQSWDYCRHALAFFHTHLPFWGMEALDGVTAVEGAYVFGAAGAVYAVYLPAGQDLVVNLPGPGRYTVAWFNPRDGGPLVAGASGITGGGGVSIGPAPDDDDWVALIRAADEAQR